MTEIEDLARLRGELASLRSAPKDGLARVIVSVMPTNRRPRTYTLELHRVPVIGEAVQVEHEMLRVTDVRWFHNVPHAELLAESMRSLATCAESGTGRSALPCSQVEASKCWCARCVEWRALTWNYPPTKPA